MRKDGYINPITEVLSKIYVKDGIDIFNYLITEENFITYHHVIKCEDLKGLEFSKEKTIENGVALSHFGHGYFHYIEEFAPDIYFHINKILLLLAKERRFLPMKNATYYKYYLKLLNIVWKDIAKYQNTF